MKKKSTGSASRFITPAVIAAPAEIAELSETYLFNIEHWSDFDDLIAGEKFTSDHFVLCGTEWELQLYPKGIDDKFSDEEVTSVACHLVHVSDKSVRCRYTFTVLNNISPTRNISWSDPEGIITFSDRRSGNSVWGTEELIDLNYLQDEAEGFILEDCVKIAVEVEIYGAVDIDSHPLTKAIESAAETKDLIALADSELSLITRTLPGSKTSRSAGSEFVLQDKVVKSRFHPGGKHK